MQMAADNQKKRTMRSAGAVALLIMATGILPGVAPSNAQTAPPEVQTVACEVKVLVQDQDPEGLNVRASPGSQYKVLGTVHAGDWIYATGSRGAWVRINRATQDDESTETEQTVFAGEGWVYASLLGVDGSGGGEDSATTLNESPSRDSRMVGRMFADDGSGTLLGCRGEWLQLEHRSLSRGGPKIRGWAHRDAVCINTRTVCN
jgi:hypothetical protein